MLICSLRERAQVEQLLRFIVEESPEDADSKRAFKYVPPCFCWLALSRRTVDLIFWNISGNFHEL